METLIAGLIGLVCGMTLEATCQIARPILMVLTNAIMGWRLHVRRG